MSDGGPADIPKRDPAADQSPFAEPASNSGPPPANSKDPSVFAEPWLRNLAHTPDPRDPGPHHAVGDAGAAEHSVWDEPGLSTALSGEVPDDAVTWYRWYLQQAARTSSLSTWLVTLAIVLVAGVAAVAGTLLSQLSSMNNALLAVTVVGPTTEELMKVALPLWLVEKRPWLFRNGLQILMCAFAGGLAFAAVENVMYLSVYVPNGGPDLALWRWTVCVLLHTGCSTVAGCGVRQIWVRFQQEQRVPQLSDGARWLLAAIVLHGVYNGTVTLLGPEF